MNTTRRDFLKYCGISAGTLGLTATDLLHLEDVLGNPNGPSVLWLQGSGLHRVQRLAAQPDLAAVADDRRDLLINSINLVYHPNLSSTAGTTAVAALDAAYARGGYVLAVEGGVPTAFGGAAGWLMTDAAGNDVTIAQAVRKYASRASAIVCMGTCAAWGGIPASKPNPTGVQSVGATAQEDDQHRRLSPASGLDGVADRAGHAGQADHTRQLRPSDGHVQAESPRPVPVEGDRRGEVLGPAEGVPQEPRVPGPRDRRRVPVGEVEQRCQLVHRRRLAMPGEHQPVVSSRKCVSQVPG
jgi:hypothetical protein